MTDTAIQTELIHNSQYVTLAGATLLLGMGTAAFTKSGKASKAGPKVGFMFTGLFLYGGVALLVYVAVKIMSVKADAQKKE